jgi:hypothetical protein
MAHRRYILLCLLAFFCCTGALNASNNTNKAMRSFWHPTFLGQQLDYCTVNGIECGKEVANRYCKMLGYDYSNNNIIAYNIGLTNYIDTRAQCKGWRCNGFMTIDCVLNLSHKPPKPYHYQEKKFAYPRYNDYRISWCYNQGAGCGRRAANSFCSRMGFMQAKQFEKEPAVNATQAIGSHELCFGDSCDAFKLIVCSR